MTQEEQLQAVKEGMNISGDYQDKALLVYLREAREYLLDAGVSKEILDTEKAIGILARGVTDLWNYGAGNGKLSPYFKERAIQLIYKSKEGNE